MTVTFISNYINHHQIPFSNACYEQLKEDYYFIQTQPMEQERLAMGWNREGRNFLMCTACTGRRIGAAGW